MTLENIIERLEEWDDSLTICVERSPDWNPKSEARLLPDDEVSREGKFVYFLEVDIAKEVLEDWYHIRDGQESDLAEKSEVLIYYAENDAYPMPPGGIEPVNDDVRDPE